MNTLEVALGARSYPIHIGSGLLDQPQLWQQAVRGRHVLIVSNTVVAPLYLHRLRGALHGSILAEFILDDGEQHKTFANVAEVLDALASMGATRDACVVALGGGVVGDLAGFAAACWMRGVDFVQVPTSLLAMVDSSVGGKTGVNLPQGKNLAGAFHQPRAVLIDIDTLATLPVREYLSGLAEVVKYGAIGDAPFFAELESAADALLARDRGVLERVIAHSCACKAAIVTRDEHELGERALLNFGHTFAHALELESGYGHLLHGEAVAIGMLQAARLSSLLGRADHTDAERLQALLERLQLPVQMPPGLDADRLLQHMRLDKKMLAGELRLILWRGIGTAEIVRGVSELAIRELLLASPP